MPMTSEICTRCNRHLSEYNTNPDRLCGYCQSAIGPRTSPRYRAWISAGKPRLDAPVTRHKARKAKAVRLPLDPAKLDTGHLLALLGACRAEVQKRQGEARALLAALEG